jgi:hypothetical protein
MTWAVDASSPELEMPAGSLLLKRGWCTYADKDGDQIFEECAVLPNSPKCTLNGGTGKFQGIKADLQITTNPIGSTYEGITQAIGTKKGTYQIPKS